MSQGQEAQDENDKPAPSNAEVSKSDIAPPSQAAPPSESTEKSPDIPQDETDGRRTYQWKSGYPLEARKEIRYETVYVVFILLFALVGLFLNWRGSIADWLACSSCTEATLRKYAFFFLSGVLGGTLFGIKFLYHVVARGFWHQDRRLWRLLSPLLAGSLALVVGALTDAGLFGLTIKAQTGATYVSLGFITGYFGDKALLKMTEIANVIFGTTDSGHKKAAHESNSAKESNPQSR